MFSFLFFSIIPAPANAVLGYYVDDFAGLPHFVPVEEFILTLPEPGFCHTAHLHAANGVFVTALDDSIIEDPDVEGCGYGLPELVDNEGNLFVVPDVVGKTLFDGELDIVSGGLIVGDITHVPSDTVPEGVITSQDPEADTEVEENTAVALEVSSGSDSDPPTPDGLPEECEDIIIQNVIDNRIEQNTVVAGTGENDFIIGAEIPEKIFGKGGDDCILGNGGDDNIKGGSGNDIIFGGIGKDKISGQEGNDLIFGNEGKDKIKGDAGDDEIHGGYEPGIEKGTGDNINGGTGDDSLFGGAGGDTIRGGASGNDWIEGGPGDDNIVGGNGEDIIKGGDDDDTIKGDSVEVL